MKKSSILLAVIALFTAQCFVTAQNNNGLVVPMPSTIYSPPIQGGLLDSKKSILDAGKITETAMPYDMTPQPPSLLCPISMPERDLCAEVKYVYNLLIPSLLDTLNCTLDTIKTQQAEILLYSIVTENKLIENSVNNDFGERSNALTAFALLSKDAMATVELSKEFLKRDYGGLAIYVDDIVIAACLTVGDEGYSFLRELARQRISEGEMVSASWKIAKEMVPELNPSGALDALLSSEGGIDLDVLERDIRNRTIIQKKLRKPKSYQNR